MKKLFLLFILFYAFSNALPQEMNTLWQIGQKDQSGSELALGPYNYKEYNAKFGKTPIVYEIGKNNAKSDFPFVLPGPDDSWANLNARQIAIRFGIDQSKSCTAQLEMNFVEVHPSAPIIRVLVNGTLLRVNAPRGNNLHFFDERKTSSQNLKAVVDIPKGALKEGNNLIVIQSERGSWAAFDNLELKVSQPLRLGKTTPAIDLLGGQAEPALIYGKNDEMRQSATLQIANWGDPQTVNLEIEGKFYEQIQLKSGLNTFETSLPESKNKKKVSIALTSNNKKIGQCTVDAFPVKKWTVYLVQHTHTDIGYTKPQTEILAEHIRYIDYAIEYCELTQNYPDDAKFRWTCEAAWAVREYLQNRPKEQIEKFLKYIRNGQIEVCGMFFNMSEIIDENSFKTFLEPIREFKKLGIPVKTAMQNDVNGIAWCLADYMPDLGVKYFSMGENGHRALIPFDRPTVYKWESPSGKSAYSYRSDHYMTANGWGIDKVGYEAMAPKVFQYLESLEQRNYPFDAVSVQYSGYHTDNSPPSRKTSDVIRDWNKKYASPKLKSALFHEFMDYITAKYDKQLPVIQAAYPDWWTDGFGSAARETAASRKTHSDMITIQGMLAMAVLKGQALPDHLENKVRHTHENLLFYDEHTYGAAESISNPTGENSMVQWAEKGSYAWEALKTAQGLYETSAGLLQSFIPRKEKPTVTFFNTLNWNRSGLIELYIDHEIIPRGKEFQIIDDKGKALKVQPLRSRNEGTYYAMYVENIPPMGYKSFDIINTNNNRENLPGTSLNNNQIENQFYKIVFDPKTGSIRSLFDKELQLEMVEANEDWNLGGFVYETLDNRQQMERYTLTDYKRNGLSEVRINAGENGPVYQSVNIWGTSDGCDKGFGVRIEIRLFHQEKRIELNYAVKKLPITDPDGIYVAFPFKLDNSRLFFDVQGGVVSPGVNQIEKTASDWNTVQNFVTARNHKAQFIVGSDAIPLFQLGGICTGQYQRKKTYEKPHVYSWVTNNYWTTNFRASQEGELRWNYYLTSSPDVSNTKATRFGWSSRVPIYARVMPEGKTNGLPSVYSAFRFNNDNFLMTSATPSIDKGYILINVRELDGKQSKLQILDTNGSPMEFQVVNAIEEPILSNLKETDFISYENKFIKLTRN